MAGVVHLGAFMGDPDSPSPKANMVPESSAAANQISFTFSYQSYFSSSLLEKAVLEQNNTYPIVQSTRVQQQVSGYAIGNHPDSQTPVAIVFSGEGRQSGSAAHIIPPGGIVRPTSGVKGGQDGFQSFEWGLPFGWLGGGTATIVVFQTKDSWANWDTRAEVLFHRFRALIYAPSGLPAAGSLTTSWPRNWPMRFPSLLTRRGSTPINQGGAPQIAITKPGQIALRLLTSVGSASSMKAVFYHTTDFSDELAAQPATIPRESVQITVPARVPYAYTAGYAEYTLFEAPAIMSRMGCDGKSTSDVTKTAGVVFVSDDVALQGQYIDVCRYGYL